MTGGDGVELTELLGCRRVSDGSLKLEENRETHALEVVEGDLVAQEVEKDVLESAGVSVRENKSVPVDPLGVGRVELHELGCEGGDRRSARMILLGLSLPTHRRGHGQQGPFPWELQLCDGEVSIRFVSE